MTGVFAPERIPALTQGLDDVPIADRRGDHADAGLAHGFMQTEVRHHGADHGVSAELAFLLQGQGAESEDTVAGDASAARVAEDHAVRVAVERDTDVGPLLFHDLAGELRIKGADTGVDVDAVGFDSELHDFGAEFLEDERSQEVARAMTAIHDDLHPVEARVA